MKYKKGDKLVGECLACGAEEIWEVESISKEKYLDGIFKTYHLRGVKNCTFGRAIRTSRKDVPECMNQYTKLKEIDQ